MGGTDTRCNMIITWKPFFKLFFRSSKEGAKNILFAMEKILNEGLTAQYFDERKIIESHKSSYNLENQKRLFDLSNKLLSDRNIN